MGKNNGYTLKAYAVERSNDYGTAGRLDLSTISQTEELAQKKAAAIDKKFPNGLKVSRVVPLYVIEVSDK